MVTQAIHRITRERVRRGEELGALDHLAQIVVVGVICRGIDGYTSTVIADTSRRNNVDGVVFVGMHAGLHRTRNAIAARFAHRDLDDTARRVGVVVGTRNGDHLDLLHVLGIERAEICRQIVAREVQHSIIDHNACARRAIDRDLVALNPDARGCAENLHTVLADRHCAVVGHIDHKAVGLAGNQSSRYHHLTNRVRSGRDCDVAQVGR